MLRKLLCFFSRRERPLEGSCRWRIAGHVSELRRCWDKATDEAEAPQVFPMWAESEALNA